MLQSNVYARVCLLPTDICHNFGYMVPDVRVFGHCSSAVGNDHMRPIDVDVDINSQCAICTLVCKSTHSLVHVIYQGTVYTHMHSNESIIENWPKSDKENSYVVLGIFTPGLSSGLVQPGIWSIMIN